MQWRLRDINFVVRPYSSPDLPSSASEMVKDMADRSARVVLAVAFALYVSTYIFRFGFSTPGAPPSFQPPPTRKPASQPNKYGDEVSPDSQQ